MKTIKNFDILLPNTTDLNKWSVVSCDQFTSQKEYWTELENFVGSEISSLNLILPEVYLEDDDVDSKIAKINQNMCDYVDAGVFKRLQNSCIVVERKTKYGLTRHGIVCAVDLEDYSFTFPNNAPIRATEGVVLDRIPPRLKVRQNAVVELPHIILLIDDRKKGLIEKLFADADAKDLVYDSDLNMDGGHLTGYRVDFDTVNAKFDAFEREVAGLYGTETNFIFAVGDGNHSLATAQAHWNNIKETLSEDTRQNHPARYALCEIENLHSDGITFEPIHRFVFGADMDKFAEFFGSKVSGDGSVKAYSSDSEIALAVSTNSALAIAQIEGVVAEFVACNSECSVDYIHGADNLALISAKNKGVAIVMPEIAKDELFDYVLKNGNLCKKSFSMGEAEEKRYYTEAKFIVK